MINLEYVWIRNYETKRTITPHKHGCYEFVYYLKGKGKSFCENISFEYDPGSYLLIAPETQHGETHEELTSMIAIGFTLENHFARPKTCNLHDSDSVVFNLVQKIRHEFKTKPLYYKQTIESVLNEILIEIFRATVPGESQKTDSFDYVISYLKEYFMADVDINQLAKTTGYCPDHFRSLFEKKTGLSPKQFILAERLSHAKKFLSDPALDLTRIAEKCGYEYYSQFSLFFKKQTGLSPSEYRKKFFGEGGKTPSEE